MTAALGTALALAAIGCSSRWSQLPEIVLSTSWGAPAGAVEATGFSDGPLVMWSADELLLVTVWGSRSCPQVPETVSVTDAHHLAITTTHFADASGDCTADLSPTTSTIAVPKGLDPQSPVTVTVDGSVVVVPPARTVLVR
jgi:hypothetical protein